MFDSPCEIRRAGVMADGRVLLDIRAVNGTFDWSWFAGKATLTRELLAIALAAITTEKQVNCVIEDPAAVKEVVQMTIIR